MTKSFKDIYAEDNRSQKEKSPTVTTTGLSDNIVVEPIAVTDILNRPTMTILNSEPETTSITEDIKKALLEQNEQSEEAIKKVLLEQSEQSAEVIKKALLEQREQSAEVLGSVMKTNTKIANSMSKLVKNNAEANEKLTEVVATLTDKIELLEAKLENFKIPSPIVKLQMPNTKTIREVRRDKNGLITHIEETNIEEIKVDDDDK